MRSSQCSRSASGSMGKYTHSPYSLSYSYNEARNDESYSHSEHNSQKRTEYKNISNNDNNTDNTVDHNNTDSKKDEERSQCEMLEESKDDLYNAAACNDDDKLVEVHDKLSIPSTPLNMQVEDSFRSKQKCESNSGNNNNISKTISSNTKRKEGSVPDGRIYRCNNNNNNNKSEECTPFSITTSSSSAEKYYKNSYHNDSSNINEFNSMTESNSMEVSTPTTVLASELSSSSLSMPINVHPSINVQPRHGRFSHGMTRWNTILNGLPLSPSSKVYQKSNSYYSSSSPTYQSSRQSFSLSGTPQHKLSSSKTEHSKDSIADNFSNVKASSSQSITNINETANSDNANNNNSSSIGQKSLESRELEQKQHQRHEPEEFEERQQVKKDTAQVESDLAGSASCSPSSMNYFQSLPADGAEHEGDNLPDYPANLSYNTNLSHKVHPVPQTYAPARFMAKNNLNLINESTSNEWTSPSNFNNFNISNKNNSSNNNKLQDNLIKGNNLDDSNTNINMEESTSTLGSPFNRSYNESAHLSYNSGYSPLRHKSLSITNNSISVNNLNNNNNNNSFSQYSSAPAQTVDPPLSVNVHFHSAVSVEPSSSPSCSPPYQTTYQSRNRSFNNYNSTGKNSYRSNPQQLASHPPFPSGHYSPLSDSHSNTQFIEPTHSPSSSFVSVQHQQHQQQQYSNSPSATSYNVSHVQETSAVSAPSYMDSAPQAFLANGMNSSSNSNKVDTSTAYAPYASTKPDTHATTTINNGNNTVTHHVDPNNTINSYTNHSNNNTTLAANFYSTLPGQAMNMNGWDRSAPKPTSASYTTATNSIEYSSASPPLSHKLMPPQTLTNFSSSSAPNFNPTHIMNNNNTNNNNNNSSSYNSHSYRSNPRRHRNLSLSNSFHKSGISINTNTVNNSNEDTLSVSSKSCSNASSVRDNLELCPQDEECPLINEHAHQRQFAHTCRLFPCYHGHIVRHAKLFRHTEGQIALQEGIPNGKISAHALASVNFSSISTDAPNAYRIYVSHNDKSYEIFGDWASVRVHTFKRYLNQVCHIRPEDQVLIMVATNKVMDDEISSVKEYGVEADCEIQLKLAIELDEPNILLDDL